MSAGGCSRSPQSPIAACLFDLDGTLIDSEPLKTQSHVRTVLELLGGSERSETEIADAANRLIGVPTPDTAIDLIARFGLEEATAMHQKALGLSAPWQAYSALQQDHYHRLLDRPGTLETAQFSGAVAVLKKVRSRGLKTALGSMSFRQDVDRVLAILHWVDLFDAVMTGDEISQGKPDPEIYLRLAAALKVSPAECLVLEDSPSGIAAALAAGMVCLAVPNALTRQAVLAMEELDRAYLVKDQAQLLDMVAQWLPGILASS